MTLTQIIEDAKNDGYSLQDVTVLTAASDPYRHNTPAHRMNAEWFLKQIQDFLPSGSVHLRGLHYRLVASGNVAMPGIESSLTNGSAPPRRGRTFAKLIPVYINSEDCFNTLMRAARAARGLGFVPF